MDIRNAIERTRKVFTKRDELVGKVCLPVKIVYFGGISKKLSPEISQIKEDIRRDNVSRIVHYLDGPRHVILPVFFKDDQLLGGLLSDQSEVLASLSDAYIELIGDGFGDTSKYLAETAYKKAQELNIPTKILIKTKRKAENPQHALNFLKSIKNEKHKTNYQDPDSASTKLSEFLSKTF